MANSETLINVENGKKGTEKIKKSMYNNSINPAPFPLRSRLTQASIDVSNQLLVYLCLRKKSEYW